MNSGNLLPLGVQHLHNYPARGAQPARPQSPISVTRIAQSESHTESVSRVGQILVLLGLPAAVTLLPLVLLVTSLRTFQVLEQQKVVHLRNRAAIVAGRLETLPGAASAGETLDALRADEPSLVDIAMVGQGEAGDGPALRPIWEGRELYWTGFFGEAGGRVYRAYVPFHSDAGLRIARIDLDATAADFLTADAGRNLIFSALGSLSLMLLSLYGFWTSRRADKLRLRQMEMERLARMGEMAAVLAHEIRNPLGTIKGFAQLIGEKSDAQVHELVKPIVSETLRLEELTNELLLYSRPPAPSFRKTTWGETLVPLTENVRHIIGRREIRFTADDRNIEWDTDPHLLQQALLNLLRNAVESIGDHTGGEVRLELQDLGSGGLTLAVTDNGLGMSEEAKSKLFEPFFTTKAFGTGLGLSITKRLVESLGGKLSLEANEPRGMRAVLRFPRVVVG